MRHLIAIILILSLFTSTATATTKPALGATLNGSSQYAGATLKGLWVINETSGATIADLSGNGNTGTLVADANFGAGNFGLSGAVNLNGSDESITCGTDTSLGLTTAGTIVAWVKFSATATADVIVCGKGNYTTDRNGYLMILHTADGGATRNLYMEVESATAAQNNHGTAGELTAGNWYQLVIGWNNAVAVGYVNGVEDFNAAEAVVPTVKSAPGYPFTIGYDPQYAPANRLKGVVDNVGVWSRLLTPAEVAALNTNPFAMLSTQTTYYVDADDGSDSNDGSSPEQAKKTVAAINGLSLNPGDTVLFKRGGAWREQLTAPSSGTAGHPITFSSYGASGAAPIISGSDIVPTWTQTAAENISGAWTEVDPGSTMTASSTVITMTSVQTRSADSYFYRDMGAAYFSGDYRVYFDVNVTTLTAVALIQLISLSDTLDDGKGIVTSSGNQAAVQMYGATSLRLYKTEAGAEAQTSAYTFTAGTTYYCDYYRDESAGTYGTQYLVVYDTAAHRLAQSGALATLSQAFTVAKIDYRYIYAAQSWNTANTNLYCTGTIANIAFNTGLGLPTLNWRAALAADPTLVYFDRTRGTKEVSVGGLDAAREWFWLKGFLYCYAASNPGALYTTPGIEAGVRSYCITDSAKDYVTVSGLDLMEAKNSAIYNNGGDYWTVTGCTIEKTNSAGGTDAGIRLAAASHSNTISSNTFSDVWGDGIYVYQSNAPAVTGNTFASINGEHSDGIHIEASAGYTITSNTMDNTAGNATSSGHGGIIVETCSGTGTLTGNSIKNAEGAISFTGGTATVTATRNRSENMKVIAYNFNTAVSNVTFAYNLSINDEYGIVGDDTQHTGMNIYNNLVYNVVSPTYGMVWYQIAGNIKNNIVWVQNFASRAFRVAAVTGGTLTSDYNLIGPEATGFIAYEAGSYNTLAAYVAAKSQDAHSTKSDPVFVSTVTPDFHLQWSSPCRDAGVAVGLTTDYDGRGIAGLPDIGAYEAVATGGIPAWIDEED
jgi:parallel beta-helix repeat protein